jgi:hypothetical protein
MLVMGEAIRARWTRPRETEVVLVLENGEVWILERTKIPVVGGGEEVLVLEETEIRIVEEIREAWILVVMYRKQKTMRVMI